MPRRVISRETLSIVPFGERLAPKRMDTLFACIQGTYESCAEYAEHDAPILVDAQEALGVCPYCKASLNYDNRDDYAECPSCGPMLRLQDRKDRRLLIKEELVAEFIAQTIGAPRARNIGGYYQLGEVRGRRMFYVTAPESSFFSEHNGDVGVLYWQNGVTIPSDWKGQAFLVREFFYPDPNARRIVATQTDLNKLVPPEPAPPKRIRRRPRERRIQWLSYLAALLSKPYNKNDFWHECLRPKAAMEWFKTEFGDAVPSEKQFQNDIRLFREIDEDKGWDCREPCIVALIKVAENKSLPQRRRSEIAEKTAYLAATLKQKEEECGHPVEIQKAAWQYIGDGKRERVTIDDQSDKFYDEVEDHLATVQT